MANKIYEVHLLNMLIKSRVTTQQGLASEEEETIKWQKNTNQPGTQDRKNQVLERQIELGLGQMSPGKMSAGKMSAGIMFSGKMFS